MKKKLTEKKRTPKRRRTPITKRLTTATLIGVVAEDLGVTPDDVRETVMTTFDAMARAVASGHDVAITNFVTLRSHAVPRHTARNPQTSELMTVPTHRVVRLRVSDHLADAVRRRVRTVTIRKAPKGSKATGR
ncbi:HU family DNA-binding protein [Streptomyces sp. NPDC004237]|uniref:HU family DNA-binding protein n=1 Tax=Streptomyces sp. NPDC004237 TaxID=3154455 RepID=UPI0033A07BC2